MKDSFDVIVVGAGAAGLMAAWELALTGKKVCIIEARDRIGGRIQTVYDKNFFLPVELGAEFVHGKLELTQLLLKKAKADYYKLSGEIWQKENGMLQEQYDFIEDYSDLNKKFKELKKDVTVHKLIKDHLQDEKFRELRFTLKNYVEGYYAADTNKASSFALREELSTSDDEQYRIEGGYEKLVEFLYKQCLKKGAVFFLSHEVKQISWKKNNVEAQAEAKIFFSQKILITVPIGVLQSEKIRFVPSLSEKMKFIKKLGFGAVVKTILQFENSFWKEKQFTQEKNLKNLGFIFSQAVIPTWWTQHPKDAGIITGWSGGPHADGLKYVSSEEIMQKALESLSSIFDISVSQLSQKLKAWYVADWANDPFSCGGYSYQVVNGSKFIASVKQAEKATLYFAGEGLYDGTEIGTVEAALISGRNTAHQIIADFKS